MEIKEVLELWDRFDRSDASEFVWSAGEEKLKFKRSVTVVPTIERRAVTPSPVMQLREEEKENRETGNAVTDGVVVRAPLVGTFYKAPTPDAKPFVEIGQKVKKGDVIGIIEAMKLMNEVSAPADGEVVQILVEDSRMVEYDQPLIVIK